MLLRNDRAEWELPGGRFEAGETPQGCVAREILEELNLSVEVGPILDAWVYEPIPGRRVLVLAYGCFAQHFGGMVHSGEHTQVRVFGLDEIGGINLPAGYGRAIRAWVRHPALSSDAG